MSETKVQFIPLVDIILGEDRFRKEFSGEASSSLQDSISVGAGLINAITLRHDKTLITGESRLRAVRTLHDLGGKVRYQGQNVPEGTIPAIIAETEFSELEYLTQELEENTERTDFTYMEEAKAVARIALIQQALIDKDKKPEAERKEELKKAPSVLGIPLSSIGKEAIKKTASQVYDGKDSSQYKQNVANSLKVVNAAEANPELAQKLGKASSMTEAQKVLKKFEQEELRASLALEQGKEFSGERHTVLQGDCRELLLDIKTKSFDVCVTDPIYGIEAGAFNNGAGRYDGSSHEYDDSLKTFKKVMPEALQLVSRVLKDAAHIYLACDIRNYPLLKQMLEESSTPGNPWKVPNAPFIQYKTAGGRVPHPGFTPRRSYELWLYAHRGGKQELKLINDVIPCESERDEHGTHGAAKPKELLKTFLNRSCMPGDKVLDFMAGSGSIIPACHELQLRVTALEINDVYFGECLQRIKELR